MALALLLLSRLHTDIGFSAPSFIVVLSHLSFARTYKSANLLFVRYSLFPRFPRNIAKSRSVRVLR
ncbi:hypothetical protein NEOLEDRAFT_1143920 [Neolentinus lepideus HHB14362 ss-1]|uniref:Secreted protein n=1 Tax=Neolentinus lepideus HHB14362 ss-1 TaxID=1314782 RepID=A0A165M6A2_9AGAM|nr:hypothetical protein NEOLEDRAFT_1143963 [Neolentinus lepideus HHB14362 ss-1]KZT18015.1 hypothetical protein NEOLEDRAFT_1143920 [Neolentinus lepideus HHB14362 ss-1]